MPTAQQAKALHRGPSWASTRCRLAALNSAHLHGSSLPQLAGAGPVLWTSGSQAMKRGNMREACSLLGLTTGVGRQDWALVA